MKRWIRRIFFILLLLLLVYTSVVLVILYTDVPRKLIVKTLNEKYGLEASIKSMQITSRGTTTINDITISPPLEHAPVLSVPQVTIIHTNIVWILFKGFELKKVEILNPHINLTQNESGTWNLQRLAYHFRGNSSEDKRINLALPGLEILEASATVTDKNGNKEEIYPIVFKGKSTKEHEWEFESNIASKISLNGKLAKSGDLAHEVNLNVNDLPKIFMDMLGDFSEPLHVSANWKGSVKKNGLSGKLQIANAQAGKYLANGTVDIQNSQNGLEVKIANLLLNGINEKLRKVRVLDGKFNIHGNQLQAKSIFIEAAQNKVSVTGNWNMEERQGDFECYLAGAIQEKQINFDNTITGNITLPKNGLSKLDLYITTHGRTPSGQWISNAEFVGSGKGLLNSQWHVTIPSLAWESEKNNIRLKDIHTEIIASWPQIKFDNIELGNAQELNAQGQFSADTKDWNISLDAKSVEIIEDQNTPVDLKLIARGNMQDILVNDFSVTYKDIQIQGNSNLSLSTKELSETHIKTSMKITPKVKSEKMLDNIAANLVCETDITGKVWPIDLRCESVFTSDNVKLKKQALEQIEIPWLAKIDSNMVTYNAEQFRLFDGIWSLDGRFDFKQLSAHLSLDTEEVSLRPVMSLFELPIECKGMMKADLDVTLPLSNMNQMVISGNWNVKDMSIPPIEAKEAEGRIVIEHGTAQFDKIRLLHGNGIAQGDAWFRLNQPQYVYVNVEANNWPISFEKNNLSLTTNANGSASLDLSKRTIKGDGDISTIVAIDKKKFADVSAQINIEERLLDFNDMTIETLDGQANGDISIPLDNLTNSKGTLAWQAMNLSELANYFPQLTPLAGNSSGTLIVKKAENKRAYEPLKIDINGKIDDGSFADANIGDFTISSYLGSERFLIDKALIETMNGQIKSYGNVSKHAGSYSLYVNTEYLDIETNQLLHAFLPDAKPVAGILSGKGVLVLFSDLHRTTGDATIQISKSDLAQTKLIGTLYNTMKLKFGKNTPSGRGQVKLRFEGSSLHIPSFEYFNRGVEVRGSGSIEDLTKGKASPVKGYAFGSARPLKGVNLLGIGELDKLMTSLQKSVASVQVNGTLEKYDVEVVPFKEINKSLRVLLWDQLRE